MRVIGQLSRQLLDLASVRVMQRRSSSLAGDYTGRSSTLVGNVTSILNNGEFLLRTTGHTYRVRNPIGRSFVVREGDRVRVYGYWSGGIWQAANLRVLRRNTINSTATLNKNSGLPVVEADTVTAPQPIR